MNEWTRKGLAHSLIRSVFGAEGPLRVVGRATVLPETRGCGTQAGHKSGRGSAADHESGHECTNGVAGQEDSCIRVVFVVGRATIVPDTRG
jgi:hypothetical protein